MKNVKTSISVFKSDYNEDNLIRFNIPSFIHERSYWLFLYLRSLDCYNPRSNKLLQKCMLENYQCLPDIKKNYLDDFNFQLLISLASIAGRNKNTDKLNAIYFSPNFLLADTCDNPEPEHLDFIIPLIENGAISLDSASRFIRIFLLGVNPSKSNEVKCEWDGTKESLIIFLVCGYFTNVLFVGDNKLKTHRKKDQVTQKYCRKKEQRPLFTTLIENHFVFTKYNYTKSTIHRNVDTFYDYILELQKLAKDDGIDIKQRNVLISYIDKKPPNVVIKMSEELSNNFLSVLSCIPKIIKFE